MPKVPFPFSAVQPLAGVDDSQHGKLDVSLACNARACAARYKVVLVVGSPIRLDKSDPPIYAIGLVTRCVGRDQRRVLVTRSFCDEYEQGRETTVYLWMLAVPKTSYYEVESKDLAPLVAEAEERAKLVKKEHKQSKKANV